VGQKDGSTITSVQILQRQGHETSIPFHYFFSNLEPLPIITETGKIETPAVPSFNSIEKKPDPVVAVSSVFSQKRQSFSQGDKALVRSPVGVPVK